MTIQTPEAGRTAAPPDLTRDHPISPGGASGRWNTARRISLAVIALLGIGTALHYGLTWDERDQATYGQTIIDWYTSLFSDRDALAYFNLYLYGGLFETIAQAFSYLSPFGFVEDRHLVNVVVGFAGIVAASKTAALIGGPRAGLFAAAALALTPRYYGDMFNNPKDIPFAAAYAWAIYFLLAGRRDRWPLGRYLQLGVATGAALAVRVGGLILFIIVLAEMITSLWLHWRRERFPIVPELVPRLGWFAATVAIAWAFMLPFWPWAQLSPFLNPLDALVRQSRFDWPGAMLFDGRMVAAAETPREYLPVWLGITLPEFYPLIVAAGAIVAVIRQRRPALTSVPSLDLGILLGSILVPVALAVTLRTSLYDGLRHFLFILPPLAVLGGLILDQVWRAPIRSSWRVAILAPIVFAASLTLFDMIELHPMESLYFNRLSGGLPGAIGRFETDYWGISYKEGTEWLIANYPVPRGDRYLVANCSNDLHTAYPLLQATDRFLAVQPDQDTDIWISTTRNSCHTSRRGKVLHIVSRQGAPLLYVVEVEDRH